MGHFSTVSRAMHFYDGAKGDWKKKKRQILEFIGWPLFEAARRVPHNAIHFNDFDGGYPGVIEAVLSEIGGRDFAIWKLEKAIANEQGKDKKARLQKTLAISKKRQKHEEAAK